MSKQFYFKQFILAWVQFQCQKQFYLKKIHFCISTQFKYQNSSYPSAEMQLVYSTAASDWPMFLYFQVKKSRLIYNYWFTILKSTENITFKEPTANNLNLNNKYLSKSNILTKILQNRNKTVIIESL